MNAHWLPNHIAQWYDDFCDGFPHAGIEEWSYWFERFRDGGYLPPSQDDSNEAKRLKNFKSELETNPHYTAGRMDAYINEVGRSLVQQRRRFLALMLCSEAIQQKGFLVPTLLESGDEKDPWSGIIDKWMKHGNLLDSSGTASGHLLADNALRPWAGFRTRDDRKWDTGQRMPDRLFPGFVRLRESDFPGLRIRVKVLPNSHINKKVGEKIRVAVVPLLGAITDLRIENNRDNPPSYRIWPQWDSGQLSAAVGQALRKSGENDCDIVVFPELCLIPEVQEKIPTQLRREKPWLVVAGSAYFLTDGEEQKYHNRALVYFKSSCDPILTHHKLQQELTVAPEKCFGVRQILGTPGAREDISTQPREIEILETTVGRFTVLIGEDLCAQNFVNRLVDKVRLDWLLVPILEGHQTKTRWPAQFSQRYASKGTAVVVATSQSFVTKHFNHEGISHPASLGVGLVTVPFRSGSTVHVLECATAIDHTEPVPFDVYGIDWQ